MFGEILWTEESEAHIARHGVSPNEVEESIYGRPRLTDRGREETTLVYGATGAGRYLFVVVAEAADGRDYIVTAREMTESEKRAFCKRRR
ncbi:MAG: hypothetical protein ACRDQA_23675 [Nocardioidaceae bacterium]